MSDAQSIRTEVLRHLQEGPATLRALFERSALADKSKQIANALYQLKQRGDVEIVDASEKTKRYRLAAHIASSGAVKAAPEESDFDAADEQRPAHPWRDRPSVPGREPTPKPTEPTPEAPAAAAAPKAAPAKKPGAQFGWWSDGSLEIDDGASHISLSPDQSRALLDFLVGVRPGLHAVLGRPLEAES